MVSGQCSEGRSQRKLTDNRQPTTDNQLTISAIRVIRSKKTKPCTFPTNTKTKTKPKSGILFTKTDLLYSPIPYMENRDDKNYTTIISELEKRSDYQSLSVAAEMKKCPR